MLSALECATYSARKIGSEMLRLIGQSILVGVIAGVVFGVIGAIFGFSEIALFFIVGAVGGAVAPWVVSERQSGEIADGY